MRAGGGIASARYIKLNLPNNYDMKPAERLAILNGGLGVGYIAEQGADDVITKTPAYFADYARYVSDRMQSWGVPTNRGINIICAADTDVVSAKLAAAVNNMAAFAENCGPYGMIGYAEIPICNLLVAEGISPPGAGQWLTAALGWSPGYQNTAAGWAAYLQWPHAGMVQMLGSNLAASDLNMPGPLGFRSVGFEFPPSSPYYAAPTQTISTEDDVIVGMLIDQKTVPANQQTVPQGIYTTEGLLHWVADGESWGDLDNGLTQVLNAQQQVTGYQHVTTVVTVTWNEIQRRAFEKYGPGGVGVFPTGTDFGAGVGTPVIAALPGLINAASWVPMPGAPPAGVDLAAVAAAASEGASVGVAKGLTGLKVSSTVDTSLVAGGL